MSVAKVIGRYFQKTDNKEILTSSMFAMIFKIVGMLSGYVFIILSIRYTSIEQYGIFSLCLAIIQCTAILARLGFDSSIVKYVSLYSANQADRYLVKEVYLKGLFLISTAGILLSTGIYFGAPYLAEYVFHNKGLTTPFRISILAIFPTIYLYFNAGALRGLKKILQYSSLVNANYVSSIVVLLALVYFFDTPYPLELSYSIGLLLICGLSFYWWYKHSNTNAYKNTHKLKTSELLSTSLPMLSAGALYIINGWTDTLFLGMFSSQEDVGIFNFILKIAAIISIVLFAVSSISAPQFARLTGNENKQQLQNLVYKSTKLIVIVTIPVLIAILICYVPFIKLFNVGFEPEPYILPFIFLCVGQATNSFCGSSSQLLTMTGHQKINGNIIFTSLVASIILDVVLIPIYGLNGAAFANMMGLIIRNILFVIYTNRSLQINIIYNPIPDILKLKRSITNKLG